MKFHVHLLPPPTPPRGVVVVVDVIRATTTAALYLKEGAEALVLALGVEAAKRLRKPGELLAGEVGGLPPPGFTLGNSPQEAHKARGKRVVMATTNGTRAAHAVLGAEEIFLGSLQNARAVAQRAGAWGREVHLVCAGKEGGVALDDLYTAGVIGQRLRELGFAPQGDGSHMALLLAPHPPLEVLRVSEAAKALEGVGLGTDVAECAQVDTHSVVPRYLGQRGEGMVFGL